MSRRTDQFYRINVTGGDIHGSEPRRRPGLGDRIADDEMEPRFAVEGGEHPGAIGAAYAHDRSGDQAGSEAKLGVGTFHSLRPVMSIVKSDGPDLPPGSRKNISTRPLGAKVGPSL